jgi:hypothetical protein
MVTGVCVAAEARALAAISMAKDETAPVTAPTVNWAAIVPKVPSLAASWPMTPTRLAAISANSGRRAPNAKVSGAATTPRKKPKIFRR